MPLRKAVARTRDVRPEEAFVGNESDERGVRLGQGSSRPGLVSAKEKWTSLAPMDALASSSRTSVRKAWPVSQK